jgi:hypothetical protein
MALVADAIPCDAALDQRNVRDTDRKYDVVHSHPLSKRRELSLVDPRPMSALPYIQRLGSGFVEAAKNRRKSAV